MRFLQLLVRTVRGLGWLTAAVLAAFLAPLLTVWVLHPWPLPLRWADPGTTAYIEHRVREAREQGEAFELKWAWVRLEELPGHLEQAVLVAEDHRFREHRGVDWEALAEEVGYRGALPPDLRDPADRDALRAAVDHVREHRDRVRGRSTLTQQLARNLYLAPDRSFLRKAQEFLIARRLELFLPKDRILELYLNVAELGPGIFGVEAASQAYFGVSAGDLSRTQAAALAATLPHPRSSNPALNPGRMAWRQNLILERLTGGGPLQPIPEPPVVEELEVDFVVPPPVVGPPDTLAPPDTLVPPEPVAPPDTVPQTEPLPPPGPLSPGSTSTSS